MRIVSLLLLLALFTPAAFAVELRGDWESAGDMPMPYEPKYDFEYDCQIELKGKGPVIAVARFTLRNRETHKETDAKTKWGWIKLGVKREELNRAPEKHGIQLEGFSVHLNFQEAEKKSDDGVNLVFGWKMDWQSVVFTGKPLVFQFTRSDSHAYGEAFFYVNGKNSEPRKQVAAQINCDKVK